MLRNLLARLRVAYIPNDTITIRLTPETIGKMVSKLDKGDLVRFEKSYIEETIYFNRDRLLSSGETFTNLASNASEELGNRKSSRATKGKVKKSLEVNLEGLTNWRSFKGRGGNNESN